MNSPSIPEGPGSVSGAPHLPDGFTATFTSRYVDTGDLRQHVVTGGDGPPLLLVHGWPQTWYAWRLVMPALARDFTVIAPDQRGTDLHRSAAGQRRRAGLHDQPVGEHQPLQPLRRLPPCGRPVADVRALR